MTLNRLNSFGCQVEKNPIQPGFLGVVLQTVTYLFLVSISNVVPAQDNLQEATKQYQDLYSRCLDVQERSDAADPGSAEDKQLNSELEQLWELLEELESAVREYGGDPRKIEKGVLHARSSGAEIELPPLAILKIKPGEGKPQPEYLSPEAGFPWKVDRWPDDARSLFPKDFMKQSGVLERFQTKWSKDMRKNIRTGWTDRAQYYFDVIRAMYLANFTLDEAEWIEYERRPDWTLANSIRFYVTNWDEKAATEEIIGEVFDKYMAQPKDRSPKWSWLGSHLRLDEVRPEYEEAQEGLRKQLLTSYEPWDMQKYKAWNGRVEKHVKAILDSEKRLLWLLGYAERQKVGELKKAQAARERLLFELESRQELLFNTYLIKRYLVEILDRYKTQPAGGDPLAGPVKKGAAVKDYSRLLAHYEKVFDETRLDVQKRTLDYRRLVNEIKPAVMKLGVEKAIEAKLLVPHKYDGGDDFYAGLRNEEYYGRIKAIKQESVYEEFMRNESEASNLSEQQENIRVLLRGGK